MSKPSRDFEALARDWLLLNFKNIAPWTLTSAVTPEWGQRLESLRSILAFVAERATSEWKCPQCGSAIGHCAAVAHEQAETIDRLGERQAKLEAVVSMAREAIAEYESHGGKGTHRECPQGGACYVEDHMVVLKVALAALDSEEKPDAK